MYQKSRQFTNYTSYSKWLTFPFRSTAKRYFPAFFNRQTGIDLSTDWKDPPINSITETYINKLVELGFEPDQEIEDEYLLTGITLPLLLSRRQIGGFLAVYKPRRNRSFLKWVKYTHPKLVGPETPLITISGVFRKKPTGLLVDSLSDYFKLINWVYCQENTFTRKFHRGQPKGWTNILPMIIYVDQGEETVIEHMRKMQMHFSDLTDFSGKFVEEIKSKMNKSHDAFHVENLHYFDDNPLPYCRTRIEFEDAVPSLKSSFPRRTLPEC